MITLEKKRTARAKVRQPLPVVADDAGDSALREVESQVRDAATIAPVADVTAAPLAVITCHFNWAGYRRPTANLMRFLRRMDSWNIPVYGVELYPENRSPLMDRNQRWESFPVGSEALMWQKEALLNRAAKLVPSHIPVIAAVDSDVSFENPAWVEDCLDALNRHRAVQPFTTAIWTDESGRAELSRGSVAVAGLNRKWTGHPGFGWVMHRSFYEECGFYPYAIMGAGDTVFATGALDIEPFSVTREAIGEPNLDNGVFGSWMNRMQKFMAGGDVGCVRGSLWHEWHGSRQNRRYSQRAKLVARMDVNRDLEISRHGYLRWTSDANRGMQIGVAGYFKDRKEDG